MKLKITDKKFDIFDGTKWGGGGVLNINLIFIYINKVSTCKLGES